MFRSSIVSCVAVVFGLLIFNTSANAGMSALSQSVTVDQSAGDATFTIDFGHTPNFTTMNAEGQQADTFEYEIAAKSAGPVDYSNLTTVIWGNDISATNKVTVRNATPPDLSDPRSGGWGTIRGSVPFSVTGDKLTFTAPLSLIGAPSGKFAFLAFTQSYGNEQNYAAGQSVPLPGAFGIGMVMLGIGFVVSLSRVRLGGRGLI